MYNVLMKRVNFYMPEPLMERLQEESKKQDVSVAELVRKAVEQYLKALQSS